ncbi:TetR/AcrR family transcriptional regulator [Rhizobium sp. CB3171]|uniref:TetR/AcrR family transcriptional regulator n=1 Tax=Rhizobium sp. CB3171 TaxID=3039157 RepID=UPI0024B255D6|nr:TetR/AcrR family transcriptional regulator [Rhizobium sp. CB3171]WFU02534.1 TetR/AcrR family transcriptional regulator [Rhizobium sp. CB3171]
MSPDKPDRIKFRKEPQQERSIHRVDVILSAAAQLIAEKGVSAMKMTELAAVAGVPIGSVYQYFPEKAAIVTALFDRHADLVQQKTAEVFVAVKSLDHAIDLVCGVIDWYYREFRGDPTYMGVWLGTEMDQDLLRLNIQHSNRVAEIFLKGIEPHIPAGSQIDLQARAQLFSHLIGASVRLAIMSDRSLAIRMLSEWKQVIRATLFAEPSGEPMGKRH